MQAIKIGMPITLELHKRDQDEPEKYKCKLVDQQQGYIYIDYPINMKTGKTGFFLEGTQFQGSFVGEDQSVYWFETEVVARKKINIPVIVLTFPPQKDLVRIQRRKYVRVESAIDVAVQGESHSFPTITHDISGGGVAVLQTSNKPLSEREKVDLTLVLPMNSGDYHYVDAKGNVVRVIQQKTGHSDKVSIEFDDLLDKDRQIIIQYCFEQQMHLRRRGVK